MTYTVTRWIVFRAKILRRSLPHARSRVRTPVGWETLASVGPIPPRPWGPGAGRLPDARNAGAAGVGTPVCLPSPTAATYPPTNPSFQQVFRDSSASFPCSCATCAARRNDQVSTRETVGMLVFAHLTVSAVCQAG